MEGFWKQRPVLVTGATGLLGSWLVARLLNEGAKVVALVRDSVPQSQLVLSGDMEKVTVVRGDITDYQAMLRAINEYEVKTCFHLAAQTIVGTASRSPLSTFETNVKGTWTVLEAARNAATDCGVVVASSDKAYGDQPKLPYTEDMPLLGSYPYDTSKACTDILTRSYFKTYGMPVAVTRCANLFGGGDLNFSRLIPGCMLWVLRGEPIVIRSDGKYKRDYLYVEDAADAYVALAEKLSQKSVQGEAFNFGGGAPKMVLDVVKKILAATGSDVPVKVENTAQHEIKDQYLSVDKARAMLGWTQAHSFEDALKKTYAWYARYHERGMF